ncbi:hypothetical protein FC26_GL001271 [Paucilactobacillus vaccinostercus DSM 20634]|uniref:Core domain-containing protein n=1 Tax=Paucilactobacillus vaccinostercus DSM 20634 TaxID=1423813 RepID=A0A0R2A5G4_9LACO|nr:iron-sulfur cluster biosynthesis family protein [Paucilactobacillus vaccinostercus]KRM61829.1 hypothetical protein FC26_GL001271 [Paucilactobacillus vaccinostercus DSM 20634]
MKINIKDTAVTYLKKHVDFTKPVILALDDGSNKYSNLGGSCAIGDKFQLVVSDRPDPDFERPLVNDAGLQLYTSQAEEYFFTTGLNLKHQAGTLQLGDDSGLLDSAVTIQVAKSEEEAARERDEQKVTMKNQIC